MPTLTTSIYNSTGSPSHCNQTRKEIKGIQIGREEVKLSLFADNMTLYIENPDSLPKKQLRKNEFSKAAGYKINIQNSVAFLYANNELSEKEFKRKRNQDGGVEGHALTPSCGSAGITTNC